MSRFWQFLPFLLILGSCSTPTQTSQAQQQKTKNYRSSTAAGDDGPITELGTQLQTDMYESDLPDELEAHYRLRFDRNWKPASVTMNALGHHRISWPAGTPAMIRLKASWEKRSEGEPTEKRYLYMSPDGRTLELYDYSE